MSKVIVSADQNAGMVATVKMGNHQTTIDESGLETGTDTGPKPMDYIMSALGSCTVITLQMYAQRKNWPLERAEVELEQSIVTDPAVTPGQTSPRRTLIIKKLQLTGNLTSEQVTRLKDISSRCPVQRTLENGLAIETVLV